MENIDLYRRKIDNQTINEMPLFRYEGPVRLIRTQQEWDEIIDELRAESVLGFDTETRPVFHKIPNRKKNTPLPPSLMQLATAQCVYIIQFSHDFKFSRSCAEILASPIPVKAGVAVREDLRALIAQYPFEPAGVVDLGEVASANGIGTHGLRNLAANFFGWRISKGQQCSNWSAPNLTEAQIIYAATDAWIGRMVYLRMQELGITNGKRHAG